MSLFKPTKKKKQRYNFNIQYFLCCCFYMLLILNHYTYDCKLLCINKF